MFKWTVTTPIDICFGIGMYSTEAHFRFSLKLKCSHIGLGCTANSITKSNRIYLATEEREKINNSEAMVQIKQWELWWAVHAFARIRFGIWLTLTFGLHSTCDRAGVSVCRIVEWQLQLQPNVFAFILMLFTFQHRYFASLCKINSRSTDTRNGNSIPIQSRFMSYNLVSHAQLHIIVLWLWSHNLWQKYKSFQLTLSSPIRIVVPLHEINRFFWFIWKQKIFSDGIHGATIEWFI